MNDSYDTTRFRYRLGARLAHYPTLLREIEKPKARVRLTVERFSELQEKLYADNRYSLLIIVQGMDTAGKDSTIKRVTSGVNPQGFQVFNFKQPTYNDVDHNYLWRYWRAMPERGRIGIFNRSYYEEVLVVRVHPEILEERKLPNLVINNRFWQSRFDDISAMEKHLVQSGTRVIKLFLNVSKNTQKARLLKRLERPDKHWKFDPRDIDERAHWDEYQHAYQEAVSFTHTDDAPWYIIPADHKWTMRAIVAQIINEELSKLNLDFPEPSEEQLAKLEWAKNALLKEDEGA